MGTTEHQEPQDGRRVVKAYAVTPDQATAIKLADELQAIFAYYGLSEYGALIDEAPACECAAEDEHAAGDESHA